MSEDELLKLLKEMCVEAYWHGENTGDYDCNFIERETWFQEAFESIKDALKMKKE